MTFLYLIDLIVLKKFRLPFSKSLCQI